MELSARAQSLKPSSTIAISTKAQSLKREGKDVIDMSAGQPDFSTPDFIKDAAKEGLDKNYTKYTPVTGMPEFKEAIRDKILRDNKIDYALDEIIVSAGGKQVIFNAVQAVLNPGDEAIIPKPYWVSYPPMVELAGGVPVLADTTIENKFMLLPEDLEKLITKKTKLLFLNSPSNPTGMVYSKNRLYSIAEICRDNNVLIVSDEIYEYIAYEGAEIVSTAALDESFKDITLTVLGLSKGYAMTGWRVGFGAGPRDLIAAMSRYQGHSTTNACSVAQYAGITALQTHPEKIKPYFSEFAVRRDIAYKKLSSMEGIETLNPGGAFYIFPKVSAYFGTSYKDHKVTDSISFCKFMLEEQLIAIVPGEPFGKDEHIRISFSGSTEELKKAMDRFGRGLKKLRG